MASQHYPLFVHWYKTLDWLLDKVERFPRQVRFSVGSRVSGLGLDIQEQIIEAIYYKEGRLDMLWQINLSLEKLRVLMRICYERRYLSAPQYTFVAGEIEKAGQMTGGWIKSHAGPRIRKK